MKTKQGKTTKDVQVRRYSDHPVVQKKLAKARAVFEKTDLSFLDTSINKQD
jgi:hypothetical protein